MKRFDFLIRSGAALCLASALALPALAQKAPAKTAPATAPTVVAAGPALVKAAAAVKGGASFMNDKRLTQAQIKTLDAATDKVVQKAKTKAEQIHEEAERASKELGELLK